MEGIKTKKENARGRGEKKEQNEDKGEREKKVKTMNK